MNRVDGKVAVVTGGTQGLGAAVARQLAAAGAAGIITCGRNAAKGAAVATAITRDTGVPVQFVPCDLGTVTDVQRVVPAAVTAFGRVDCVVNAAGATDRGTILDTTPELFDHLFAVNVRAPFFLIQDAMKVMVAKGIPGSIINIGSISEVAGQPFITPYCSSKGALASLTRNVAFAALRNRIRVNQLDIGWMSSDAEDAVQRQHNGNDADWLKKAEAEQPFGRLVSPEEVARAVGFLASDDSGLLTGAIIPFDQSVWGGFAAGAPHPAMALSV